MTVPSNSGRGTPRRRGWVGGILLALVMVAVGGWLYLRLPHPPVVAEVPVCARTNLMFSEGRWYQLPESNAYTGWMVEYYPDGALASRISVSNGLLNGVAESWFTNRQPQVREFYVNSISHGLRQKWYENGQLKSEAPIVQGKLEGPFRSWHENGQLAESMEMRQGHPEGKAWAYYASGFVKAETQVHEGRVLAQQSWQDGERPPVRRDGGPNSDAN